MMKNKEIQTVNHTQKRLIIWALVVSAIITIPYATNAPWTGSDYIFAGTVLFICAAVYEYTTRNMVNIYYKVAVALAILFFIFIVIGWAAAGP